MKYLLEMIHGQGKFLQGEQDELKQGGVGGGLWVGEPRVQQLVAPHPDKSVSTIKLITTSKALEFLNVEFTLTG